MAEAGTDPLSDLTLGPLTAGAADGWCLVQNPSRMFPTPGLPSLGLSALPTQRGTCLLSLPLSLLSLPCLIFQWL